MTAINAPARYSPTSTVPASDSTAIKSTPARPFSRVEIIQYSAGTNAEAVAAIQKPSAISRMPVTHSTPPIASAPTVNATSAGSNHDPNRCFHDCVPVVGWLIAHSFRPG